MKERIKRLLVLLLCVGMLSGCGIAGTTETTAPPETVPPETHCTDMGTPLADLRVRQALCYAVDLDKIVETLFYGTAQKAVSFTAPGQWLNDHLTTYEYNPKKAEALLADAGWPEDYVLDVVYYYDDPMTRDFLDIVGQYWAEVGVRSQFRKLEGDLSAQLWAAPANPETDRSAVDWDLAYGAVAALSELDFYSRFSSRVPTNSHTPPVPGLDDLLTGAASTLNTVEQKHIFSEIQAKLAAEVWAIPLYHQMCFVYTSDHLDTAGCVHGNDQYTYEKDLLNWVTDREDRTLYTNGGPVEFYVTPNQNPGISLYQELVFDRLLSADSYLVPQSGGLAQEYQVSPDSLSVSFELRQGLKWHDGKPLTAEDVAFTYELYLKAPDANPVLAEVLSALTGAEEFRAGVAEHCTGITVEENRITFTFDRVASDALTVFSQWPILPRHCLTDADPAHLQEHRFWKKPIGSGPYKVRETKLGQFCTLSRWDGYWKLGTGNIDTVYLRSSGENDPRLIVEASADRVDYAWSKSADDCVALRVMEGMNVAETNIRYTRCFYINKFPH